MFEAVLRRDVRPKQNFGAGSVIAAAFYSGVVWFGAWAQHHASAVDRQDVAITFVARVPPPRLAPPPAAPAPRAPAPAAARPRLVATAERPVTVLTQAIVAPTEIPSAAPPEREPDSSAAAAVDPGEGFDVPAVPGGIVNPVVDASVWAGEDGGRGAAPPEFDARMEPPEFVSGPSPQYTQKALEREVEGIMEVRCVVTTDGRVRACRVARSLPFMDRAVIDALERRRYRPATLGGRPVEVFYRFRIPLQLTE